MEVNKSGCERSQIINSGKLPHCMEEQKQMEPQVAPVVDPRLPQRRDMGEPRSEITCHKQAGYNGTMSRAQLFKNANLLSPDTTTTKLCIARIHQQ